MTETPSLEDISTKLERIAELARKHPERVFSSLHHVIDEAWLREAMRRVRKDAAVGVDGQSFADYEENLGEIHPTARLLPATAATRCTHDLKRNDRQANL